MAQREKRDVTGRVTETPEEATGAENSKDSFNVLTISLVLAALAGLILFAYFGILPGMHHPVSPTP